MSAPKKLLFCDIDHVLSDAAHRDRMIDADHSVVTEPVWELYHCAAKDDKPIRYMINIVNAMFAEGYQVILITARPLWCRSMTCSWLTKYNVSFDQLIMRPNPGNDGYNLRSPVLKAKQISNYIEAFNLQSRRDDILLIDDRKDICDAMAKIGIQTLQFSYNRHDNEEASKIWQPQVAEEVQEQEVAAQAAAE